MESPYSRYTKYPRNTAPPETRFNVRVNGVQVATAIARKDAEEFLGKRLGFVQIHLSDKPIEGRRPAWTKQPLPRMPTLHTSEKSRAEAMTKVLADKGIEYAEDDTP